MITVLIVGAGVLGAVLTGYLRARLGGQYDPRWFARHPSL